ncbi:MAG: pirin family protein [Bdellovibrionota bacterium]
MQTITTPLRMGFGALRVLNDDTIAPGKGFGTHPHQNMEIVTIVLTGALAHKDTMGNSSTIQAGEVQRMSAGTGVAHSEFNASPTDLVKLLQIWIFPHESGILPSYDQKKFSWKEQVGRTLLVSPDGRDGTLAIHQQAYFGIDFIKNGQKLSYLPHQSNHGVFGFIIDGEFEIDGENAKTRDAVAWNPGETIQGLCKRDGHCLWIEVPMEI